MESIHSSRYPVAHWKALCRPSITRTTRLNPTAARTQKPTAAACHRKVLGKRASTKQSRRQRATQVPRRNIQDPTGAALKKFRPSSPSGAARAILGKIAVYHMVCGEKSRFARIMPRGESSPSTQPGKSLSTLSRSGSVRSCRAPEAASSTTPVSLGIVGAAATDPLGRSVYDTSARSCKRQVESRGAPAGSASTTPTRHARPSRDTALAAAEAEGIAGRMPPQGGYV
mmetsp:Transcript_88037/g.249308  ORF Transcript_88037/g.249308 Transcript_88037/m.249308 type:complete len:228 (-) Transcript_88037:75-758(-)